MDNDPWKRKRTRDFSAEVDADAKPPFVDVSSQCDTLDILNCGLLRICPSVCGTREAA